MIIVVCCKQQQTTREEELLRGYKLLLTWCKLGGKF
jgi:hypothetical protein